MSGSFTCSNGLTAIQCNGIVECSDFGDEASQCPVNLLAVSIFVGVLASAVLVFSIACAVFVLKFRVILKPLNPPLLAVSILGALVALASVPTALLGLPIDGGDTDGIVSVCRARIALPVLGFTLICATAITKAFTLVKIFFHRSLTLTVFSVPKRVLLLVSIVTINAILVAAWFSDASDSEICQPGRDSAWFWLVLTSCALLCGAIMRMAFQLRECFEPFRETRNTALVLFAWIGVVGVAAFSSLTSQGNGLEASSILTVQFAICLAVVATVWAVAGVHIYRIHANMRFVDEFGDKDETPADLHIATATSDDDDTVHAVTTCFRELRTKLGKRAQPTVIAVFATNNYDMTLLKQTMNQQCAKINKDNCQDKNSQHPKVQWMMATTCTMLMSSDGLVGADTQQAIGMFALSDMQGYYQVVHCPDISDQKQIRAVIQDAQKASGMPCSPDAVCMFSAAGCEDTVCATVSDCVGSKSIVFGGTSADNLTIDGQWYQASSASEKVTQNGLVMCLMWPTGCVKQSFYNAYNPCGDAFTAKVTRAEGRRVYELDGKPCAEVYNKWRGGALNDAVAAKEPVNVFSKCAMSPIGQIVDHDYAQDPIYSAYAAHFVQPDNSIDFFAKVPQGATVSMLTATHHQMIHRIGKVAQDILRTSNFELTEIVGAMCIICVGCMIGVKQGGEDGFQKMSKTLSKALGGKPVIAMVGYGEQGSLPSGRVGHANLTFSVIVFSNKRGPRRVQLNVASSGSTPTAASTSSATAGTPSRTKKRLSARKRRKVTSFLPAGRSANMNSMAITSTRISSQTQNAKKYAPSRVAPL